MIRCKTNPRPGIIAALKSRDLLQPQAGREMRGRRADHAILLSRWPPPSVLSYRGKQRPERSRRQVSARPRSGLCLFASISYAHGEAKPPVARLPAAVPGLGEQLPQLPAPHSGTIPAPPSQPRDAHGAGTLQSESWVGSQVRFQPQKAGCCRCAPSSSAPRW